MEKTAGKTLTKTIKTMTASRGKWTFSKYDFISLIMAVFGYFIGRVVAFEFLNPLSTAYICQFISKKQRFPIIAIAVAIGTFTKYTGMYFFKYIFMILIISVTHLLSISNVLPKFMFGKKTNIKMSELNLISKSSIAFAALFIGSLISFSIYGYSSYITFMTLIESFFATCLTIVINQGSNIMQGNIKRKTLSNEELISLSIIIGSIICGSADIHIGYISIRDFFSAIIIMLIAFKSGASLGATAGVLIGFMLCISGYGDYALIGILSLSGLLSGCFRESPKYGKVLAVLGYLGGSVVLSAYLAPYIMSSEFIVSIALAGSVFLCVPDEFYFDFGSNLSLSNDNSQEYAKRVKELTVNKLEKFAKSFYTLGKSFSVTDSNQGGLTQKEITKLIDESVNQICVGCEKCDYCWREHIYDAYGFVYNMLSVCDRKGMACVNDGYDNEFINACIYKNEFLEVLNRQYMEYRKDLIWQNRIIESRDLVSQQLIGVAGIMTQLAEELNLEMQFDESIEDKLVSEFVYQKIPVTSVVVAFNKLEQYEINLSIEDCNQKHICTNTIIPIVNNVLGRKMKKTEGVCSGSCKFKLVEEQSLRVATGIARTTKYNSSKSGDSYSFMEFEKGQYFLALSDGMGSGNKASKESTIAIELLEEFIESGFKKDLAIKMINSVLLLKNNEDFFSTLDICTIDLYTGIAEFIKIGAVSTYIIRNNVVHTIKSSSLPMGILNSVDLEICCKKVKENDIIVMLSDGITESHEDMEGKEAWLINLLENMPYKNQQDIADTILEAAKKESGGIAKDDMTVLVAKIWKKI